MKIIGFFNNKGGVGKTSLVFHLAWKFSDMGYRVLAADLDPQANLSAMFLPEEVFVGLLEQSGSEAHTIHQSVQPLTAVGDIEDVALQRFGDKLALIPGDISLSLFEDALSRAWLECLGKEIRPYYVTTAFYRIIVRAAAHHHADLTLVDVGPNLGAINRASLLAMDHVIFPVGADLYSLHGLRNLGPTLQTWRNEWADRRTHFDKLHRGAKLPFPRGAMEPSGYLSTQHSQYAGKSSKAYRRWQGRIPEIYQEYIMECGPDNAPSFDHDPNKLAELKHYRSLMPMAQEVHKPIFHLTPAEGAIGSHFYATRECGADFQVLAKTIAARCGVTAASATS